MNQSYNQHNDFNNPNPTPNPNVTYTFDYVIVGAGPGGLTLAHIISKYRPKWKVLLVEREKNLGGCHRVRRSPLNNQNIFTEHGPRIYLDNYLVFRQILNEIGTDFYDEFVPYTQQFVNAGVIGQLGLNEISAFAVAYFKHFTTDYEKNKQIILLDWMKENKFSPKVIDLLDRACRMTDGAGADKYTLWEMLELLNQNALYTIHQPKLPTDQGFIKKWSDYLTENRPNLTIWTSTQVEQLTTAYTENGTILKVTNIMCKGSNGTIYQVNGKHFFLAIPPKHLLKLLNDSGERRAFDDPSRSITWDRLVQWEQSCRYLDYISITYHWTDHSFDTEGISGLPEDTDWGLVFIVLTDYMKFPKSPSKTVITLAATRSYVASRVTGKTADQTENKEELLAEIFRQMTHVFPKLSQYPPNYQLLSAGVEYNSEIKKWESIDTAFQFTTVGFGPRESAKYSNLYSVGAHNGNSNYNFTSAETAIQNATQLCHKIVPESIHDYQIPQIWTVKDMVIVLIVLVVIVGVWYKFL